MMTELDYEQLIAQWHRDRNLIEEIGRAHV